MARDDVVEAAVADHEDDVEQARELGGPVAHKEAERDHGTVAGLRAPDRHEGCGGGAEEAAEDGAEDGVAEAEAEDERAEDAGCEVVGRDVGAEPEDGDLEVRDLETSTKSAGVWRDGGDGKEGRTTDAGCRSSGATRVMPRASKPERPSMRLLMRWNRPMTPASLPAPAVSPAEEPSAETTSTLMGSTGRAFSRSCVAAACDIVSPTQSGTTRWGVKADKSIWVQQGGFLFLGRRAGLLLVVGHVTVADVAV